MPNCAATVPRVIDLSVKVGAQGFSGETSLGPDDLVVKGEKWKTRKGEEKEDEHH